MVVGAGDVGGAVGGEAVAGGIVGIRFGRLARGVGGGEELPGGVIRIADRAVERGYFRNQARRRAGPLPQRIDDCRGVLPRHEPAGRKPVEGSLRGDV